MKLENKSKAANYREKKSEVRKNSFKFPYF